MGEYIDVGLQNSIIPFTIVISSVILGIYALFGVETENDDDDSDSGSGGLMQPIWDHLKGICLVFLLITLKTLDKEPRINILDNTKENITNITKKTPYIYDDSSTKIW